MALIKIMQYASDDNSNNKDNVNNNDGNNNNKVKKPHLEVLSTKCRPEA